MHPLIYHPVSLFFCFVTYFHTDRFRLCVFVVIFHSQIDLNENKTATLCGFQCRLSTLSTGADDEEEETEE